MKVFCYIFILIFLILIFGEIISSQDIGAKRDYKKWEENWKWLMLKKERKEWKKLKSDKGREQFIERFWKMRDPDLATFRNEFRLILEERLEVVEKEYPNIRDARRYIYLIYGKPLDRKSYAEQPVTSYAAVDGARRINIGKSEVWEYVFSSEKNKKIRIIFSQLDVSKFKNWIQQNRSTISGRDIFSDEARRPGVSHFLHPYGVYDILYFGGKYRNAGSFIKDVLEGQGMVAEFGEWLDSLGKLLREPAKKNYKVFSKKPEVEKNKYPNGDLPVRLNIHYFPQKQESGLFILLRFDKTVLSWKRNRYIADLDIFFKLEDMKGREMVRYEKNDLKFEYKKIDDFDEFYFSFPMTLLPGNYRMIYKIGDGISKRKKQEVIDIIPTDFNTKEFMVLYEIGKVVKRGDIFKADRNNIFQLSKDEFFVPDIRFSSQDEIVFGTNIYGFQRDNKGNPYILIVILIKEIDELDKALKKFESLPIEESRGGEIKYWQRIKIEELGLKPGGYKVEIYIKDELGGVLLKYPLEGKLPKVIIIR